MKRTAFRAATALLAGVGFLTLGQMTFAAGLKCAGTDGKTVCSAKQVADLNQGIVTGRRMHKPLMMVREVTLGPGGALRCTQTDGKACTDEQLDAVAATAASTHSAAGEIRITREVDRASP